MGKYAALLKNGTIKTIGAAKMSILENLIHGNLTIHQELINKFIREALSDNKFVKEIQVSISGGFIYLAARVRAGEKSNIDVKVTLSLGSFEFNRLKRFIELPVHGPVLISLQGLEIKARLGAELEPDPAKRADAPEGLVNLLNYLNIEEEKLTIDFNRMSVFNQVLQKKLGFFLKYLEIARLELAEGMLIIQPAIKFF